MTVGITSLPIRSSPARGSLLLRAVQQLAHVHTSRPSSSPIFESMLARARSDYEANGPPQRSQQAKSFPPPSSPTKHNGDIRQQMKKPNAAAVSARTAQPFPKPLDNRSTNMNQPTVTRLAASAAGSSLASLYGGSNSFQQDPDVIDLTEADVVANAKAGVFFCENDFSDDDELDLDFKAPSALPMLPAATPSKPSKENMPPPPTSQASKPIDWSSSPVSHFLPPPRTTSVTSTTTDGSLKRESSGDQDLVDIPAPKKAKKRVLPPQFKRQEPEEDEEDLAVAKTPANKRKEFWNPTASAVKEQKKQFRNQRQQEQPTTNNDLSTDEIQEITKSHSKAKGNFAISLSEEQRHVLDLVVNNNQSVFFTGAAGTGKSVLMRAIITELKKKYAKDPERVAVTASTGLAACNIGGITLHSFSGIGLGKEDVPTLVKKIRRNQKAKNRWLRTKCLIIDEVSMVDGDLFDKLSQIGRTIRNNGRPWGGIQLIITGDFFQLPPVPDGGKRETKFAFDASTWTTSIDHTIGLTQVFRQRDPTFANMLNEMRLGRISEDTVRAFKSLSRPLSFDDGVGTAELFSTRNEVEGSNERRLRELSGTVRRYDALDVGKEEIRDKLLMNMMAPKSIDLKINAQVMLIKNLDESLVNGSLGKVIGFSDEKTFDMTSVDEFDDDDPMAKARRKLLKSFSREADTSSSSGVKFPVVQFMATNGTSRVILCQPEEWKVELPNGEVQAKRTQLPLILAWALSIHKAQGQTLERVKVNLGRVFEKGQAYVALSRATTQEGLQVLGFEKSKVMAHPRVIQFYNQLYSAEDAIGKKPQSITDFVSNRLGAAPPKKAARQVVELDDEEEAMASYGY